MAVDLPDAVRDMFAAPNFASLSTLMRDGSPHVTPMWVDLEDGFVLMNTAKGRIKHRNLERDPRVAVCVFPHDKPYSWAQVRGRARLREEDGIEVIDRLSQKYTGRDYPLPEGMERITIVIEPEDVSYALREAPGKPSG